MTGSTEIINNTDWKVVKERIKELKHTFKSDLSDEKFVEWWDRNNPQKLETLERVKKLERAFKSRMSNKKLAQFCDENNVRTNDWTLHQDSESFSFYTNDYKLYRHDKSFVLYFDKRGRSTIGYKTVRVTRPDEEKYCIHLLYLAALKGQEGLLRIPEKYRKNFTGPNFDEYTSRLGKYDLDYTDYWRPSPYQVFTGNQLVMGKGAVSFIKKHFPKLYEDKFYELCQNAVSRFHFLADFARSSLRNCEKAAREFLEAAEEIQERQRSLDLQDVYLQKVAVDKELEAQEIKGRPNIQSPQDLSVKIAAAAEALTKLEKMSIIVNGRLRPIQRAAQRNRSPKPA